MNNHNWDSDFPLVTKGFHDKLCSTLAQLPNKEEIIMSREISLRCTLVFAAIAVMVLATTAFAVGTIYSIGGRSNNRQVFTQLPTANQMQSIINASPKLIEQFDNGYQFEKGVIVHAEDMDESGNVVSKYKALALSYSNDSQRLELSIEKQKPGRELPPDCTQSTYGGIAMYAFDYVSKTVPLDYVKTEQEKLDEAAGRVNFGYMGGDTVETTAVKVLSWNDGEVSYLLQTHNNPLTGDELVAMAKQIIDQV